MFLDHFSKAMFKTGGKENIAFQVRRMCVDLYYSELVKRFQTTRNATNKTGWIAKFILLHTVEKVKM